MFPHQPQRDKPSGSFFQIKRLFDLTSAKSMSGPVLIQQAALLVELLLQFVQFSSSASAQPLFGGLSGEEACVEKDTGNTWKLLNAGKPQKGPLGNTGGLRCGTNGLSRHLTYYHRVIRGMARHDKFDRILFPSKLY